MYSNAKQEKKLSGPASVNQVLKDRFSSIDVISVNARLQQYEGSDAYCQAIETADLDKLQGGLCA